MILGSPHGTTPAAVIKNQIKMFRLFKSKENLHKTEEGPDCTVSNNKFSSVTCLLFQFFECCISK